jgi:hypothetical protein
MGTSKDFDAPKTPPWRDLKRDITRNLPNPAPLPRPPDPQAPDDGTGPEPDPDAPQAPGPPPIPRDLQPQVSRMSRTLGKFVRAQYGRGGGAASGGGGSGGAVGGGGAGDSGARQSAQRVGQNLGRFFSTVATEGVPVAAQEFGVATLEGKSTREIARRLTDALGGPATTTNDTDARNALTRLMNELLKDVPANQVPDRLEQVARGPDFANVLYRFFGYYIFEQFNRIFYARLQRLNQSSAAQFLKNGLHCIQWMLRSLTESIDVRRIRWSSAEGAKLVTDVMERIFRIFSAGS